MTNAELIDEAGNYVTLYMKEHPNASLLYHDLQHTRDVVSAAIRIANHYHLGDTDFLCVVIAAWFHDIGYFAGKTSGHEAEGAEMAERFLQGKALDAAIIDIVKRCILSTQMPQRPVTLLEKIVCDADLFHLGGSNLPERSRLLRKELELTHARHIDKSEWRISTIELLQNHQYHTDYCQLLLSEKKQQNLDNLLQKQAGKNIIPESFVKDTAGLAATAKKEKTSAQPGRGIETMFRITSANNQRLSDMADNKAHILITVNSIILSAIISLVLRKLEENSFLTLPTFALLTISVVTIVISIIATRPSIPSGVFNSADLEQKKVNLLFFGNFYKMKLEEYESGMRTVMADTEFLYGTLIKDVYSQGVVLGRKYRLLRLAYTVFMFGIVVSVLGYVAVFIMWK